MDIYENILLTPKQGLDTAISISLTWLLVLNLNVTLCHCKGLWIRKWRTKKMGYFVREIQKLKDLCRIKSCPCYCLLLMTRFSGKFVRLINCTPYKGQSYFSKLRRTRRFESVIAVFWTTLLEDIGDRFKLRLSSSPLSLSGFWIKIFVDLPPDDGSRAQNVRYFLSDRKANSSLACCIWSSIFRCTLSFLKDSVAKVFESSVYCH